MSRIFRSDAVSVGDRVVVRRTYGSGASATHSDVIGHVLSLDPLVVRPQQVGGFPSSLEAVTISKEELHIIKRLSPRTVRNSDIRAVEAATAAAFPGIEHTWTSDGQWLMRAGDGITERSNSAVPLGPSAGFTPLPLAEITDFYARHNLPTRLLLPERLDRAAEWVAHAKGWRLGPEIIVMTMDLGDEGIEKPRPAARDGLGGLRFAIDSQPDDDWLALYHFRGRALPRHALELLREQIDGRMGFARLRTDAGETVAITRATLTHSGDGRIWLGFSAVEVADHMRRNGLGTRLSRAILDWGRAELADAAYLQVIATNTAGIGLYHKLGFIEHHRHRCAEYTG